MVEYKAPLEEIGFVLAEVAGLEELSALPGYQEAAPDLVGQILEEAGKLASDVLSPLNQKGDQEGCLFENGVVRTPAGFTEAYRLFCDGGWNALPFDPEFGGHGLPWAVAGALGEMWNSANMSFALCPLLTQGAVELLSAHGSKAQKAAYLGPLIAGSWTGTMNLTEPQAGSDVGAIKTRARADNGHYRISGQKIYITFGEHDFTDNIVHMVLARTPDAPPGTKGISLFIVPKFLVKEDGSLGARNDLRCVSIEHKLGINASPTCVMSYGENEGAIGYLVGEENRGMEYMFTMMNNARMGVGIQGLGIAERAYQQARDFAFERTQGRSLEGNGEAPAPIVRHAEVRRTLMTMKSQIEAMRALCYFAAGTLDRAKRHPEPEARRRNQAWLDFLTPIAKAWSTDLGVEAASLGLQVHGGMGYIEETGAAQYYRDARIAPIYEGTNGIQALDLVGRKVLRDKGETARSLIAEMREILPDAPKSEAAELAAAIDRLEQATDWLLEAQSRDPRLPGAAATPYLRLAGTTIGGWLQLRQAAAAARRLEADGENPVFLRAKQASARFYCDNVLPQSAALAQAVLHGAESLLAVEIESL